MRRTWLVFATLSVVVAMVSLVASPAMARSFFHNGNGFVFTNNNGFDNGNVFVVGHDHGFFNTPSVFNGTAQESETGNVNENFSVGQSGSNSNQCVTPQQFGNTGSFQNAQPVLQFNSDAGGFFGDGFFGDGFGSIEPEGGNFTFAPSLSGGCTQPIEQSAAAG